MELKIEETPLKNKNGDYIKHLTIDNIIWMSNDDIELEDIERSIKNARGDCFIGGLGLGLIAEECAKLDRVTSVTVFEINKNIIKLVVPGINNSKIQIFHGDAISEFGNMKYDWMYLDTYLEPTENAFLTEVVPFSKNCQQNLKPSGIVDYWCKNKMDIGDFAPFDINP